MLFQVLYTLIHNKNRNISQETFLCSMLCLSLSLLLTLLTPPSSSLPFPSLPPTDVSSCPASLFLMSFRLFLKSHSGTAGRQSSLVIHGADFSTKDVDNDNCMCKCALMLTGGECSQTECSRRANLSVNAKFFLMGEVMRLRVKSDLSCFRSEHLQQFLLQTTLVSVYLCNNPKHWRFVTLRLKQHPLVPDLLPTDISGELQTDFRRLYRRGTMESDPITQALRVRFQQQFSVFGFYRAIPQYS